MEAVGLNIQLNGEADFTRSIANITAKSKELASELKLVSGAYGDNDKKIEVLNKQIQNQQEYIGKLNEKYNAQKKNLDDLGKELQEAKAKYGENSKEVADLQKQYDKAETALSGTKTQINKAETALNTMNKELDDAQKETGDETKKVDKMGDEMEDTGNKASGLGEKLKKGFAAAGKVIAGVAASAAAAGAAIYKMGMDSAATADEIDKGSIRMGISTDYYQKLAYAAGQSGVEMSTLEKAAKTLEKSGSGLNFRSAIESIMDMEDASERANRAAELFGESVAYELSPLIEQSEGDFDGLINRAEELGLVMAEDDVKAGVTLGDTMADVKKSFKALATNLGSAVTPIIQKVGDFLLKNMPKFRAMFEKITPVAEKLLESLAGPLMQAVEDLLPVASSLIGTIAGELGPFVSALLPPILGVLKQLAPILEKVIQVVLPLAAEALSRVLPLILELASSLLPLISDFLDRVGPVLSELVMTVLGIFVQVLEEFFPFIQELASKILPILADLIVQIGPVLTNVLGLVSELLTLLGPILNLVMAILEPLLKLITKILPVVISFIDRVVTIIRNVLTPIINGLRSAIEWLTDKVNWFSENWRSVWNGIKTFFAGVGKWLKDKLNEIGGFFTKLWDGMKAGAKAGLNGLIWLLNKAIDGLNAILAPLRAVIVGIGKVFGANWDFSTISIPHIPALAKGGILQYGTALVGEKGPELLTMMKNGGAKVTPLTGANGSGVTGAGDTITLNVYGAEGQDVNALADIVMDKIQAATTRKRASYAY